MKKSYPFCFISFLYLLIIVYTPHICGVPSILFIIFFSIIIIITKNISFSFSTLFFIICISIILFFTQFINGILSKEACTQLLKFLSLYINILFFYQFICKRNSSTLTLYLSFVLLTNSIFIIFCVHLNGFQDLLSNIFSYTDKQSRYHSFETSLVTRFSGLAPSGFSYLSLYTALLTIFTLHYSKYNNILKKLLLFLSLISIVYIGRTGLFILLTYILFINPKTFIILLSCGITFILDISSLSIHFVHAFELLHHGIKIYSIDTLLSNELFLPDLKLFGHGTISRIEGGPDSDIGFVKYLHFMGPYFLFITLILFFIFINSKRNLFSFIHYFFFFCFIVINLKDFYFLSSGYAQALIFISLTKKQS